MDNITIHGKNFELAPLTVTYTELNGEITITGAETGITNLIIPSKINNLPVTQIAANAFDSNPEITIVSLPDTLTHIGSNAFSNTSFYKNKANWENNVLYIGKYLIIREPDLDNLNSGLNSMNIIVSTPSGNSAGNSTPISEKTFTVKDGTILIAYGAFTYNTDLTAIEFPDSLKYINERAFQLCSNLKSISFDNNVTLNGAYTFNSCRSLEEIYLPKSYNPGTAYYDFSGCEKLKKITIDENNDKYTAVNDALYSKDKRTLYVVPAGITSFTVDSDTSQIYTGCFCDNNLSELYLSNNSEIPYNSFRNAKIGTLHIPKYINIKPQAFQNTSVSNLDVASTNSMYSVRNNNLLYDKSGKTLKLAFVRDEDIFTVPNGTETLDRYSLYDSGVNNIILPKSVTKINDSAIKTYYYTKINIYYAGTEEDWNNIDISRTISKNMLNMHYAYSITTPETYALSTPVKEDDNISVTVTSASDAGATQEIIIALYDDNGKFIGFDKQTVSYSADEQNITFTGIDGNADKAKVFVWNSASYMRPASESVSIDLK